MKNSGLDGLDGFSYSDAYVCVSIDAVMNFVDAGIGEPVQPVHGAIFCASRLLSNSVSAISAQSEVSTMKTKTLTPADQREAAAALADIRRRPAYHLACIWLERLIANSSRPRTKGLLVGVDTVVYLMRASLHGRSRGRPTISAALADLHIAESVLVALHDRDFHVAERPQRWCAGRHLACNVRDRALWESVR